MEFVLAFLLIILTLTVVGGALYFLNEFRTASRFGGGQSVSIEGIKTELDARYQADIERLRAEARGAVGEIEQELGRLREGLRSSAHEHDTQLARIRDRYSEAEVQTASAFERALGELRSYQEVELTRLRDAVGGAMAAFAVRQGSPDQHAVATRKADAIAALYRRLAKLETSYLSLTNPVLLPGESFELPAELLPDTLKWENWKEFGDAAFAFAEAFNQDRIFLDDATCRDLAALVSTLREAMTSTIYPSLLSKSGADPEETKAQLRTTLDQIGHELQEARGRLERVFRDSE
jgi:hypothetical protein